MNESASTVNIVFKSPARANRSRTSIRHKRNLEGVPVSTAQQMVSDFTAYQHQPSTRDEKKLYEYQPRTGNASEDEVFVALDFGEIVALEVDRETRALSHAGGRALSVG